MAQIHEGKLTLKAAAAAANAAGDTATAAKMRRFLSPPPPQSMPPPMGQRGSSSSKGLQHHQQGRKSSTFPTPTPHAPLYVEKSSISSGASIYFEYSTALVKKACSLLKFRSIVLPAGQPAYKRQLDIGHGIFKLHSFNPGQASLSNAVLSLVNEKCYTASDSGLEST